MQVYFKLATQFKIIDKPSERGLHKKEIIRGGGIVLFFTFLYKILYDNHTDFVFSIGFLSISLISFLDDIKGLSVRVRFLIQFISIVFLLESLNLTSLNVFLILILIVFVLSIINAFNFMDGINGITGLYAISCLFSLIYVNSFIISFTSNDELIAYSIAVFVFLYYNFRRNAICFFGDIGSIGISFILIYYIFKLIIVSEDWKYLMILSIYGIDTIYTVIFRLSLKQNIFKPHKLHFYQILVYKYNLSHLLVSMSYFLVQIFINILVIGQNSEILFILLPITIIIMHIARKRVALAISI